LLLSLACVVLSHWSNGDAGSAVFAGEFQRWHV
jgi:hypothetical protein